MTESIRPQALIFDWDNTLVDSWAPIHEALNLTFAAMEYPLWTLAETRLRVRQSLRDAFPAMFGDRWDQARRLYLGHFEAIHLQRLTPLPGAGELLQRLGTDGMPMALVSNKTGRLLRREVAALGWEPYFQRIVGAGDAAADKPDPAPVTLALAESGIAAGPSVWFIGDTGIDLECAAAAGCVPVLLHAPDDPAHPDAEPLLVQPRHRLRDFTALLELLAGPQLATPLGHAHI